MKYSFALPWDICEMSGNCMGIYGERKVRKLMGGEGALGESDTTEMRLRPLRPFFIVEAESIEEAEAKVVGALARVLGFEVVLPSDEDIALARAELRRRW